MLQPHGCCLLCFHERSSAPPSPPSPPPPFHNQPAVPLAARPSSRRAIQQLGAVPLLAEMLDLEADAPDTGAALQVLAALAEEPSNRYMLGSNAELLGLLGKKMVIKVGWQTSCPLKPVC